MAKTPIPGQLAVRGFIFYLSCVAFGFLHPYEDGGEVQEEYDSLEDSVGATYLLDAVEKAKIKSPGLSARGYTEKTQVSMLMGNINLRSKIQKRVNGLEGILHL